MADLSIYFSRVRGSPDFWAAGGVLYTTYLVFHSETRVLLRFRPVLPIDRRHLEHGRGQRYVVQSRRHRGTGFDEQNVVRFVFRQTRCHGDARRSTADWKKKKDKKRRISHTRGANNETQRTIIHTHTHSARREICHFSAYGGTNKMSS